MLFYITVMLSVVTETENVAFGIGRQLGWLPSGKPTTGVVYLLYGIPTRLVKLLLQDGMDSSNFGINIFD